MKLLCSAFCLVASQCISNAVLPVMLTVLISSPSVCSRVQCKTWNETFSIDDFSWSGLSCFLFLFLFLFFVAVCQQFPSPRAFDLSVCLCRWIGTEAGRYRSKSSRACSHNSTNSQKVSCHQRHSAFVPRNQSALVLFEIEG